MLDRAFAPAEALHPDQSGFRLVSEGTEAFITRMQSARVAVRSLDVQIYIWHSDLTGNYLAQQLIESADRGVHVRLLLDDLDARAKNSGIASLAAHPNIRVRLFNPFVSRQGPLRKAGEGLTSFERLNHRMHNKTWIADNRVAIVGGRNVGDEYFGASDQVNFVDLDFSMIGPVVRDASASFDRYWNSSLAYPIEMLDAEGVNAAALQMLRKRLVSQIDNADASRYAEALRSDDAVQRLIAGNWPMEWSATYTFVADDPLKLTMAKGDARITEVAALILPQLKGAQTNTDLISPYFVPESRGRRCWCRSRAGGQADSCVTNSLAANDVAAVHGGYSQYRKPLLAGGDSPLGIEASRGTAGQFQPIRIYRRQPAHESLLRGQSNAVRRQLQSRSAIDVAELRTGRFRRKRGSCRSVRNDVRVAEFKFACVERYAARRWPEMERRDDSSTRNRKLPVWRRFQAWFARALHLEAQL